eukprot:5599495-Alexandrium_andersonii.AAC.1
MDISGQLVVGSTAHERVEVMRGSRDGRGRLTKGKTGIGQSLVNLGNDPRSDQPIQQVAQGVSLTRAEQ